MHCRSDVPALDSMVRPVCLVRNDFGAKWCQWDLVEVKVAKELVVCRKFWGGYNTDSVGTGLDGEAGPDGRDIWCDEIHLEV